jgi:peptidylprolyl isomerase
MLKPVAMAALAALVILSFGGPVSAADPENTLYLDVPKGRVVIELRPDLAPKTVAQIKALTRRGFYDGIKFHRVIPGFMAQTGDPTGTGSGGSGKTVPAEFTQGHFVRGSVGMARSQSPDSGDSQFFICFAPAPFLDGKYTLFGQVTSGMENIDAIKAGSSANNGTVDNPDKIVRMQVAADVDKKK